MLLTGSSSTITCRGSWHDGEQEMSNFDPLQASPLFGIPVYVSDLVPEDTAYLWSGGLYVTEKQFATLMVATGEVRPGSKTVPASDFVCDGQLDTWLVVVRGLLLFLVALALLALLVL